MIPRTKDKDREFTKKGRNLVYGYCFTGEDHPLYPGCSHEFVVMKTNSYLLKIHSWEDFGEIDNRVALTSLVSGQTAEFIFPYNIVMHNFFHRILRTKDRNRELWRLELWLASEYSNAFDSTYESLDEMSSKIFLDYRWDLEYQSERKF